MHALSDTKSSNISWVILINLSFAIIEVFGGLFTNSLTILSDALHDFGDSLVLIVAWLAEKKATTQPDQKRTFGYKRLSLASAIVTSIVMVTGSLFILSEAIPRLMHPVAVNSSGMIILGVLGVIFNGFAFFKLKGGHSMNEKTLTWHLLEDVLGWIVVLIGSIILHFWHYPILDPIMTIGYTVFILWGVIKNLKESFNILMQGVPSHIDLEHIRQGLLTVKNVVTVHDLHVWSLDGETDVFTGHIVVKDEAIAHPETVKKEVKTELGKHHIEHSTVELESESECSGIDCEAEGTDAR